MPRSDRTHAAYLAWSTTALKDRAAVLARIADLYRAGTPRNSPL